MDRRELFLDIPLANLQFQLLFKYDSIFCLSPFYRKLLKIFTNNLPIFGIAGYSFAMMVFFKPQTSAPLSRTMNTDERR